MKLKIVDLNENKCNTFFSVFVCSFFSSIFPSFEIYIYFLGGEHIYCGSTLLHFSTQICHPAKISTVITKIKYSSENKTLYQHFFLRTHISCFSFCEFIDFGCTGLLIGNCPL